MNFFRSIRLLLDSINNSHLPSILTTSTPLFNQKPDNSKNQIRRIAPRATIPRSTLRGWVAFLRHPRLSKCRLALKNEKKGFARIIDSAPLRMPRIPCRFSFLSLSLSFSRSDAIFDLIDELPIAARAPRNLLLLPSEFDDGGACFSFVSLIIGRLDFLLCRVFLVRFVEMLARERKRERRYQHL